MKDIGKRIIQWYHKNKRDLPWRKTNDPYLVWISEIILQQTRVDQGTSYYLRFVERFPDVKTLAMATQEEVLKYWQGLGYYSRARNLHSSAKYIFKYCNSEFPNTYKEILKLKGVGPYTAAAISSISLGLPYPVIDGNVIRVISRLFGIKDKVNASKGFKKVEKRVHDIFIKEEASNINQAMMEFGALYCKPNNPDCENCIFNQDCNAHHLNMVEKIPFKERATKPRDLFLYYFFIYNKKGDFLIRKRDQYGIWKNLYDFPCIESNQPIVYIDLLEHKSLKDILKNKCFDIRSKSKIYKHQLSHKTIYAQFLSVCLVKNDFYELELDFQISNLLNFNEMPVPKLIEQYITDELSNFNF